MALATATATTTEAALHLIFSGGTFLLSINVSETSSSITVFQWRHLLTIFINTAICLLFSEIWSQGFGSIFDICMWVEKERLWWRMTPCRMDKQVLVLLKWGYGLALGSMEYTNGSWWSYECCATRRRPGYSINLSLVFPANEWQRYNKYQSFLLLAFVFFFSPPLSYLFSPLLYLFSHLSTGKQILIIFIKKNTNQFSMHINRAYGVLIIHCF